MCGEDMVLYGLKSCDTCRKALKAIPNVEFKDVRSDGVPTSLLTEAIESFGADIVNTRSTTWRSLEAKEREQSPLELLKAHPTLMKRPLIVDDPTMYLGWTKDVQAKILG